MRLLSRFGLVTLPAAALLLAVVVPVPAASAADGGGGKGGPSTAGVVVTANQPAGGTAAFRLTLAAHTSKDAVPSASLVLVSGDLVVLDYVAHRVAVGEDSCSGGHGGDATATAEETGTRAMVRGVGVLGLPWGGLPAGAGVQVWIDLKDAGPGLFVDQARVRVRQSPHGGEELVTLAGEDEGGSCGSGSPWLFDSMWVTVQQVKVHALGYTGRSA